MIGDTNLGITGTALVACAISLAGVPPLRAQEVIELPAEDRWLDADFEELYRVGSMQGGDWDTFGRIATVAFDATGNLYVLDTQAAGINVVGLEGNLVRQFGRVGEGPGEFDGDAAPMLKLTILTSSATSRLAVPSGSRFQVFRPIPQPNPSFPPVKSVTLTHPNPHTALSCATS